MECAIHPGIEAVSFCSNCGTPLCQECVVISDSRTLCQKCQQSFASQGEHVRSTASTGLILQSLLLKPSGMPSPARSSSHRAGIPVLFPRSLFGVRVYSRSRGDLQWRVLEGSSPGPHFQQPDFSWGGDRGEDEIPVLRC